MGGQSAVQIDARYFRDVMGKYPTGVAVVAATESDGQPVGMVVGSFSSVSLDPPLVSFMPAKSSTTWPRVKAAGRFCVSVLSQDQEAVCRALARSGPRKFEGLAYSMSPGGAPYLDSAVAIVDCVIDRVVDAGDHEIVLGGVERLEVVSGALPLLFFEGGYGSFVPASRAATPDIDLLDHLRAVDLVRPEMERVAVDLATECTAMALVGDDLVVTAAAGRAETLAAPTRVGQRFPFMYPLGGLFAVHGAAHVREAWITTAEGRVPGGSQEALRVLEQVARNGFSFGIGFERSAAVERVREQTQPAGGRAPAELIDAIRDAAVDFNPPVVPDVVEFRSMTVPVLVGGPQPTVAMTLSAWGPARPVPSEVLRQYAARLQRAAREAARMLSGQEPVDAPS